MSRDSYCRIYIEKVVLRHIHLFMKAVKRNTLYRSASRRIISEILVSDMQNCL